MVEGLRRSDRGEFLGGRTPERTARGRQHEASDLALPPGEHALEECGVLAVDWKECAAGRLALDP